MKRKALKGSFEQTRAPLLFLLPNLVIFSLFIILPAVSGLRLSVYEWGILGDKTYIGLANFKEVFTDAMFWRTFINTLRYVLFVVPLLTISALAIALIASDNIGGVAVFRGFFYLPTMLSLIIVGIIWRWILGDQLGILNYALTLMGSDAVPWLTTPLTANISLIFITVWNMTGFYMVMFIDGLQAIPEELYDAAMIDGASKPQIFWNIKLPLIRPTMLVVIVLATINSFKAFELIFTLTKGGPGTATKLLVQNIYQVAFEQDRLGYASAMAVILMITIGVLTIFQFRMNSKEYTNE